MKKMYPKKPGNIWNTEEINEAIKERNKWWKRLNKTPSTKNYGKLNDQKKKVKC